MKNIFKILLGSSLLLSSSCISQFIPKTTEDKELLVVEGLITDQSETYKIKISRPAHLGSVNVPRPVSGCNVSISDNNGNNFSFNETTPGLYISDSTQFQGVIGRFYTLHITSNFSSSTLNYASIPMELKPVPPVDSIYYEKVAFSLSEDGSPHQVGAQIYLDTHDPKNECKYFRWEFRETWEFRLPYMVPNAICWISSNSDAINIENTSVIAETRINKHPITLISFLTDRLREKYSILVHQYSMSEDEYLYWEKLQNISEQVGGLYDMIPSAIPSNINCIEDPTQRVLGYFSVSASSSRRIFIRDNFPGVISPTTDRTCIADSMPARGDIPGDGTFVWVIINHPLPPPGYRVITRTKGCYDCTVRGTNIKPAFWEGD